MSILMDDISRLIASPIPRRKALRMLGGVVGGSILASLGLERASHAMGTGMRCIGKQVPCNSTCCNPNEMCCGGTCYGAGVQALYNCCGTVLCSKASQQCCGNHCCSKKETCCGLQCCSAGRSCCHGQCCAPGAVCCGTTCCGEGKVCCNNKCVSRRPSESSPCVV